MTAPGVAGMLIAVTLNVCAGEEPQELLAMTVTLPAVALAVALMEVLVELPVHPPGNDQV